MVRARFDFAPELPRTEPNTTVKALTEIAGSFAREWTNRPSVRFTRFALGLVAVQAKLDTAHPDLAKDQLRAAIRELSRIRRAEQAFLADVREGHLRMAATKPGGPFSCEDERPHHHNWVLLVDNLDHEGGAEFMADH